MEKFLALARGSFVFVLALSFVLTTGLARAVTDNSSNAIAEVNYDSSSIVWTPTVEKYEALLLTVFGPGNVYFEQTFLPGERPVFKRIDNCGTYFPDGPCVYELRLIPSVNDEIKDILSERRFDICTTLSSEALALQTATVQSGSFTIEQSEIVVETGGVSDIPDGDAVDGQLKSNDVGHLDDVYIDGSLCLGFDCANGTSFGFDTQVFKEHNLRIYFQDTSYAASYPTNDWRIVINDSSNGGGNYFSVYDAGTDGSSSTQVFTLEGGAPANSLYVDDYGRVGFGTSTPYVELHAVDGDTPTLRLQQDGSSGWAAQTWDVAGNESNFFIRDATGGSALPFRIFPGAPTSTLTLNSSGNVGIGTASPGADLHISKSGEHSTLWFESDVDKTAGMVWVKGGSYKWMFREIANENDLKLYNYNTASDIMTWQWSTGNVGIGTTTPAGKLDVNGSIYQRGGVLHADYVFEPEYELESIEEHSAFMYENKHLKAVPKAEADENGIEIVEVGSHRRGILEELEKAHIYIHQLSTQNKMLEKRMAMLETFITKNFGKAALTSCEKK